MTAEDFKYNRNGKTIIPEQRIILYEWLLARIKKCKDTNNWCYMCNQISFHFGIKVNIGDKVGSSLPELAQQRPDKDHEGYVISGRMAWYDSNVYDERIKHVEDAIALWNSKYKK